MSEQPPRLIDRLTEPCGECAPTRALLAEFNQRLGHAVLIGTTPDPGYDDRLDVPGVYVRGPFEVHCPECRGSAVVLTAEGKDVLTVLSLWLPRSTAALVRAAGNRRDDGDDRPL